MPQFRAAPIVFVIAILMVFGLRSCRSLGAAETPASLISLDGEWRIAVDPQNVGREQQWFANPSPPTAKVTRVPWIIQDAFPAYHGVAWYWRDFDAPVPFHKTERILLRFWAVDYLGDVWLNGVRVGGHEGGETPFVLDVTDAVHPGAANHLVVRVLNPANTPIDGVVLNQTPHQARIYPYSAGSAYDHGGITGSVEVLSVPAVRIEDLFAQPDPATGVIHVRANVRNAGASPARMRVSLSVAPAAGGERIAIEQVDLDAAPGDTLSETDIKLASPHLWDLNDPYMYRLMAYLRPQARSGEEHEDDDERSVRCGFRDFRINDGYFCLNGRRIFLRSTHTCNHFPVGLKLPPDPDMARRDLIDLKAMGFNMVRFIWGGAERYQLDLCDEIGLLVYEEHFGSSQIDDTPRMAERFDRSISELIRRDRNHPSIVIWGLLNELSNTPHFRHVTTVLPLVRAIDSQRLVFLNAGRFDGQQGGSSDPFSGLELWHGPVGREPWIVRNPRDAVVDSPFQLKWPAGAVVLHPGQNGEYSTARWTCPPQASGTYRIKAIFTGLADATTDVHVLHNGKSVFDSALNLRGLPNEQSFAGEVAVAPKDAIDLVVGWGNESYGSDSTRLAATLSNDARTFDLARDYYAVKNDASPWSYGWLKPGQTPDAATFTRFAEAGMGLIGSVSNPGAMQWQNLLSDQHIYPRVPHTADIIQSLRKASGGDIPLFVSEYGIGSAMDLWRTTRHFERLGKTDVEDARFYRDRLEHYLADYRAWKLADTFARPEDFFIDSQRKMAGQRSLGLSALRSNPNVIGYSLTGMNDHVSCGEGLTTTFRELKPGTVDAMFEGWAPLKWCLFAEPANVYRGATVTLDAVLANEDAMRPGEYPARIQVIAPDGASVFDREVKVTVAAPAGNGHQPPMAIPVLRVGVPVNGPAGKYRLLATLLSGGAATGGETCFYVDDPATMPEVKGEVTLYGTDELLVKWLAAHHVHTRPFRAQEQTAREVILVGFAAGASFPFADLARHVARGSTVVFLEPGVFDNGKAAAGFLPLEHKGVLTPITGWLYLKDEWSKNHPIFAGLPSGGLMDYTFYRELIPDLVFSGQDTPAEAVAGAIKASQDYSSGLMVSVYKLGSGRIVLNTLRIRENLGSHPPAERLLRNMLNEAARDAGQPLTDLPRGFDAWLSAVGYAAANAH